jgi:site-specific recombinase
MARVAALIRRIEDSWTGDLIAGLALGLTGYLLLLFGWALQ